MSIQMLKEILRKGKIFLVAASLFFPQKCERLSVVLSHVKKSSKSRLSLFCEIVLRIF